MDNDVLDDVEDVIFEVSLVLVGKEYIQVWQKTSVQRVHVPVSFGMLRMRTKADVDLVREKSFPKTAKTVAWSLNRMSRHVGVRIYR